MKKVILRFKKGSLVVGVFFSILALTGALVYASWTEILRPDLNSSEWHLYDVNFTSSDEGWAVGSKSVPVDPLISRDRGVLLHYRNGSWTKIDLPDDGSDWWLAAVHFTSSTEGWAVGHDRSNKKGVLLNYFNGSWTAIEPPNVSPDWGLSSIYFSSPNEGWAVGVDDSNSKGVLLYYLNGFWASVAPPSLSPSWFLNSVHFTSPAEGWAVGWDDSNSRGVLLCYLNGSWTLITPPAASSIWSLSSVHFSSSAEGWAVGWEQWDGVNHRGVLLRYQNGSWTFISPPSVSPNWLLYGVHFTSPDEGWAVGEDRSNKRGVLLYYWKGSWTVVPSPNLSVSPSYADSEWYLHSIHFTSPTEGWVVGSEGLAIDLFPIGLVWEHYGVLLKYVSDFEIISTPETPKGPSGGFLNTIYTYSTAESSSNLGHSVQYFFDWGDGTNSGWLPVGQNSASKSWALPGSRSVKAQARCAQHTSVISSWSGDFVVNITNDKTSPAPNPMTWAEPPHQTGTNSISMVASIASDPTPPISYYFDFGGSPTGGLGGKDSGWQPGVSYTNSKLQANHKYGYRLKAKDAVNNQTAYPATQFAYTAIQRPAGITFGTITSHSIQVRSTNTPSGLNRGSSGLFIENTTNGTHSGRKRDNTFWSNKSLAPNTSYSFRAKARNGDGIETDYGPPVSKYTRANLPGVAHFSDVTYTSIRANWRANGNPSGTQYFCQSVTTGANSGWITDTSWNSDNLACTIPYSFRVKAKNEDGIETAWTSLGSQSTVRCIILLKPNGGETIPSGSNYDIQWAATPEAVSFDLFYSVDNGQTWRLISENVTGTAHAWAVPPPRGNKSKCLVMVKGYNSAGKKIATDRSDRPFTIRVLKLISPDGNEVLRSGDISFIIWQVNKTLSEVSKIELYYSLDNGATWKVIRRELPGGRSDFDWKVPQVKGVIRKARVRIVLKDSSGKILGDDRSNGLFTITDGRRHINYKGDLSFWVDWVNPHDKVTRGNWASLGGLAFGKPYTYKNCPEFEPVKGFSMTGKNLTSGMEGSISHAYSRSCGILCACLGRWAANFPLVLGYNILSISAYNSEGSFTNVLETIKRIPLAPTGIAVAPGDGQNTITWNDVPDATSYNIYWSESYPVTKASGYRIKNVSSPYIHSGLTNGKTYYYVVTASAANVESDESKTVLGTAGWNIFILDSVSATADMMESSIGVDAAGRVHVRYSFWDHGFHQAFITNSTGSWTRSVMPSGDGGDLIVDRDGNVHVIYSGYQGMTYGVKAPTGEWVQEVISNERPCGSPSLALDSTNQPHIAYFTQNGLLYTTKLDDIWSVETVDSSVIGSCYPGGNILVIDNENNVHIVYSGEYPNYDLMYTTDESGSWEISTVDSSGDKIMPENVSASVDSSGRLHVVYISGNCSFNCNELKYVTNASGPWTTSILESGSNAKYLDIAVDKDDQMHISFYDSLSGELKYMTNRSGLWETVTVDRMLGGTNTSIAIDSMNSVHITYYDIGHNLKYATNILTR
jgi:hypothetical protein